MKIDTPLAVPGSRVSPPAAARHSRNVAPRGEAPAESAPLAARRGPAARVSPGLRARLAALACAAAILLPGAASAQAAADAAAPQASAVRVTTNMGSFVIELNAERAPLTVRNFLRYVNEGFYTNTLFHRVVGNFVVQGGGHDATTMKLKDTHESVVNESGNGLENTRGTVGMARSGPPHSGNSQFYVNLADNTELDPLPTRWGYAVFGRVTEGMEVLERIGVIATGSVGPFKSEAPLKPVVIEKVEPLGVAPAQPSTAPAAPSPPPATDEPPEAGAPPADTPASGSAAAEPSPPQ